MEDDVTGVGGSEGGVHRGFLEPTAGRTRSPRDFASAKLWGTGVDSEHCCFLLLQTVHDVCSPFPSPRRQSYPAASQATHGGYADVSPAGHLELRGLTLGRAGTMSVSRKVGEVPVGVAYWGVRGSFP